MLATVSNGIINAPLRITEVVLIQGPRLVMPLLQLCLTYRKLCLLYGETYPEIQCETYGLGCAW